MDDKEHAVMVGQHEWLVLLTALALFPSQIKNKVPATLSREDLQNKTIKDLQTQLHKVLSPA